MMDSDQASADKPGSGFGEILSEARKARNLTLGDVRDNIKVAEHILSALEAEDLVSLPDQTYIRGYLRAYAKFLEIPDSEVLDRFNRIVPEGNPAELKPRSEVSQQGVTSQSPVMKTVTISLVVILFFAVIYGGYQYYRDKAGAIEHDIEAQGPSFTGNSLDSPGSVALDPEQPEIKIQQNARMTEDGQLLIGEEDRVDLLADEQESYNSISETIRQKDTEDIADDIDDASTDGDIPAEQEPEQSQAIDAIMIYAENGSWLQVHDANEERLFYNMLPEGGRRTLQGTAPFSVSMGNADTTEVEVNGLKVDLSKYIRSNNTARFKVSSEDGSVIFH